MNCIITNDRRENGGSKPPPFERPEGMTPPEGMELPEGMEKPEGTQPPEGMERPEGMQRPDGQENLGETGEATTEFNITDGGNMFRVTIL